MKKYDEMANDVFRRIEEYNIEKQRKRKIITRISVSAMCFCIVAILGIGAWQIGLFSSEPIQAKNDAIYPGIKDSYGPDEKYTNSTGTNINENVPAVKPFISMCSLQSDGNTKSDLIEPNQAYKCRMYLNFASIKGLTQAQIEQKLNELNKSMESTLSQSEPVDKGYHYHYGSATLKEKGYIVSKAVLYNFTLNLDISSVKKINVSNTSEFGQIDVLGTKKESENSVLVPHGKSVTIEKERITEDICFSWNYADIDKYLKENPNPSYKDFNDSFLFTVEFDDGTIKTATVNIEFNNLGEGTVVCDGYKSLKV